MAFFRGFKSQCERRSVETRKKLGLEKSAPMSAFYLCQHLGITVWSTSGIETIDEKHLLQLNNPADDSWSAFTMRIETHNLIVHKSGVSDARVNSVVMHEISHILLGHELAAACVLEDGSLVPSNFSQEQENEADWLGGTLLLPRPALLSIRQQGLSNQQACELFGVSSEMLQWRIRMTGVDQQLRLKSKYA